MGDDALRSDTRSILFAIHFNHITQNIGQSVPNWTLFNQLCPLRYSTRIDVKTSVKRKVK